MDNKAKTSLFCSKCHIEYTTMDQGDSCVECGDELKSDYEYGRPLNGFLKEDTMEEEVDMSGKCGKCGGPMEKWKESKNYTCIECYKKDNPRTPGTKGTFTPQKTSKPARSIDELAEEMKSCMIASNNLLKDVDKTIKWASEDVRATGNTLFIQKNREG